MLAELEVVPLFLNAGVGLELHVALGPAVAVADVARNHVGEQHRVDALAQQILAHGHEHEVNHVDAAAVDGLQQMPPAGGHEFAPAAAQGARHGGHGDAGGGEFALLVDDDADVVEAQEAEVGVDVAVDHVLGQGHEAVEVGVGLVDEVEEGVAVLLLEHLLGGYAHAAQPVLA